ncbi:MAG: TVP38/TMEM64 family protein [Pyrinomonadaceae bacterium]
MKQQPFTLVAKKTLAIGVTLIPLTLIVVLFFYFDRFIWNLKILVEGSGIWGPLIFIGVKAITYTAAPISGESVKILGGTFFGFWQGLLYVSIGDLLGGSINFWLARLLGERILKKLINAERLSRLSVFTAKLGTWRNLLFARIVFSAMYDFLSYAAGFSKIPFWQYLVLSFIGGLFSSLFWVAFGANFNNGWAMLIVVGTMGVFSFILWRFRKKMGVFKD